MAESLLSVGLDVGTTSTQLIVSQLTISNREPLDCEKDMPYENRGFVANIKANIGAPRLDTSVIPVNTDLSEFIEQPVKVLDKTFYITAVSWGNPHVAMFVDSVDDLDVEKYGREIENMTELFVNKTNVTFAQLVNPNYIKMREWERGTGETIGCGTGCCTAVVAGVLTDRCDRQVTVEQIGGPLDINWDKEIKEGNYIQVYNKKIKNSTFVEYFI